MPEKALDITELPPSALSEQLEASLLYLNKCPPGMEAEFLVALVGHLTTMAQDTLKAAKTMKGLIQSSKDLNDKGRLTMEMAVNEYPFASSADRIKLIGLCKDTFVTKAKELEREKKSATTKLGDRFAERPDWGRKG